MRIEFSIEAKDAPSLMKRMSEECGIPAPDDVLDDYAIEIRRTRGRFVWVFDDLMQRRPVRAREMITQASLEMMSKVESLTRNFVLFCFMQFWPLGTSVYMRVDVDSSKIDVVVADDGRVSPRGFKKLV
jgi:hypothetical protein